MVEGEARAVLFLLGIIIKLFRETKLTNRRGDLGEKGKYGGIDRISSKYIMHDCENTFMKPSAMFVHNN